MGYHKRFIKKGVIGEISKIREELEELEDASEQEVKIMIACELSDLFGAIEAFAETQGLTMADLEKMSNLTRSAFREGHRK
jgi:phosphoribosyl-ATP pyrophosphohydrolase